MTLLAHLGLHHCVPMYNIIRKCRHCYSCKLSYFPMSDFGLFWICCLEGFSDTFATKIISVAILSRSNHKITGLDSLNKEKHVTLQCYNPGEATQRNFSLPQSWLLIQEKQFLKLHCFRKMTLESKRLHQNQWSWCYFAEEKNIYAFMHSLIWFSPWFLWNLWL